MPKEKNTKKIKKELTDQVEEEDLVEDEVHELAAEPLEELDPDILKALNAKPKKAPKTHEIDYIPERELKDLEDAGFDDASF